MSSPYWKNRNKREKRFPNNYEYKSSSPKNAKKKEKTMLWNCKVCGRKRNTKSYCENCSVSKSDPRQHKRKTTYINERGKPLSKAAIKGVKSMKREKKKQDYRVSILKKQVATEKKKLSKLKKKLKTLD